MATTDQHLAIGNEETAGGQRSKRSHYHYAFNTLLLIILLSLFVFGFNRVTRYEKNVTRSTFVVQGTIPVRC